VIDFAKLESKVERHTVRERSRAQQKQQVVLVIASVAKLPSNGNLCRLVYRALLSRRHWTVGSKPKKKSLCIHFPQRGQRDIIHTRYGITDLAFFYGMQIN
jgi:hypothetical protein